MVRLGDGGANVILRARWAPIGAVVLVLGLAGASAALAAARLECRAPQAVCAVRDSVFAIASFDDASATLIAPGLMVTNRHNVADVAQVTVFAGRRLDGRVVPTAYPGDLVLIEVPGLDGPVLAPGTEAEVGAELHTVAADLRLGRIRVYPPGRLSALPAAGRPLAHLHSTAFSQYGNSGGALVDRAGRLIGIVTSGGEGRYAAIPAAEIERLRAASGPEYAAENRRLGTAYAGCRQALDGRRPQALDRLMAACRGTGNRQLFDLAATALRQARRFDDSVALFRLALAQDPNSVDTKLGLLATYAFARRPEAEAALLKQTVDQVPDDFRITRRAIMVGQELGDQALIARGLALIREHHPEALAKALEFLGRAPQQ